MARHKHSNRIQPRKKAAKILRLHLSREELAVLERLTARLCKAEGKKFTRHQVLRALLAASDEVEVQGACKSE